MATSGDPNAHLRAKIAARDLAGELLSQGVPPSKVRQRLLADGWSPADADLILGTLKLPPESFWQRLSERLTLRIATVIILRVVAGACVSMIVPLMWKETDGNLNLGGTTWLFAVALMVGGVFWAATGVLDLLLKVFGVKPGERSYFAFLVPCCFMCALATGSAMTLLWDSPAWVRWTLLALGSIVFFSERVQRWLEGR